VSNEQALIKLAQSTAEAIRGVLETIAPGTVVLGAVDAIAPGDDPFAKAHAPAVLADVSYVDGVTGGNKLAIAVEGARRLATAMMGGDPNSVEPGGELDELEMSAVGEAMNQMMSAAAMATTDVLGEEVEIAPPDVRIVQTVDEARASTDHSGQACTVEFTLCGAPCLVVQLVPNAFITRISRAFDELTENYESAPMSESLRTVSVRVWAELGRARMASGRAIGLPGGAIVELNRELDEPIDLYADGMRFATARLLVTEDGGLAVRIEALETAQAAGVSQDQNPNTNPMLNSIEEVA
jgi:flagellar motor switch protein FliN